MRDRVDGGGGQEGCCPFTGVLGEVYIPCGEETRRIMGGFSVIVPISSHVQSKDRSGFRFLSSVILSQLGRLDVLGLLVVIKFNANQQQNASLCCTRQESLGHAA